MQLAADQIAEWSNSNFMNIIKKTKEMLLGPVPLVAIDAGSIDRVTSFKLLGDTTTNDMNWREQPKHFLKLLKRSAMTDDDLLLFYVSIIRPVLEYTFPIWSTD